MAENTPAAQIEQVVEFLRQPASYADGSGSVEVVETHISWVFLTDQWAYKLKKPVKFEFVDFSTVERRHSACQEEVRLNRRLAPDVYIGVVPVTRAANGSLQLAGDGDVIDWLVQMKRLPADKAVDVLLATRQLTPTAASAVAQQLVGFYDSLPPAEVTAQEFRESLARHVRANGVALRELMPEDLDRIQRIQSAQLRFQAIESGLFDRRVREGRVVEGHGDLRPEHIYLTDPPAVIDCLEFSRELRTVDVADELSFLEMECRRLGDGGLGQRVLAQYMRASGDDIPRTLLAFYRAYRACVRAKIAVLRAAQEPDTQQQPSRQLAQRYLELADRDVAELGRPVLVVVGGMMGSGKSTLATKLADIFGAEWISTDHIRQTTLGSSAAPADYGRGLYEPGMRDRVYDELFRRAGDYLEKGRSVILDGTFLGRQRRERAYALASNYRAPAAFVLCMCPKDVALARIGRRAAAGAGESEARVDLYDQQSAELESPSADEPLVPIDTTLADERQLRLVCDGLRGLLRSPTSSPGISQ